MRSNTANPEDKLISLDRMRYTKDKLSANLVLFAIILDALYFVKLYQMDRGSYFYNWEIGASVIYNLLFLLIAFLCSEGCKNRLSGYMPTLLFLGVMQFVRITQMPAKALKAVIIVGDTETSAITKGEYAYLITLLIVSGICLLVAAVTNTVNNKRLHDYMKTLEKSA